MFPGVYDFRWETGHLLFLGIFYAVVVLLLCTLIVAVWRSRRDIRQGIADIEVIMIPGIQGIGQRIGQNAGIRIRGGCASGPQLPDEDRAFPGRYHTCRGCVSIGGRDHGGIAANRHGDV